MKNLENKVYVVNEFITLKLEDSKTNIYINGRLFNHCKFLLLDIQVKELCFIEDLESIDDVVERLDKSLEKIKDNYKISPEEEFWGHCSNFQIWAENKYNTCLFHRNLAFPILKKLTELGDIKARRILKDEIGRRIDSGNEIVIKYLIKQNFLDLLDNEEFLSLLYDSNDKLKDHFQNIFVDRRNFEDFVVPLLLKIITLDEKNIFQSYRSFGSNLICQLLYQFQELYKKYRASNLKNWIPYKKIVEYLGRFNTNLKLKCFRGVLIPPSEVSLLKEIERQIYYPFNKSHGRFKQVKEFAYNPQKAQDWKFNIEYIWGEEDAQFVVHNNHVETVAFRDINECGVCYNKDEGWYPDLDECNKCGLEYIPESLKSMNYLKNLFIYGSREHLVLDFPKMSNELKDLSLLLINGIWIRDLENLIDKLPALKALDLSKNNLESIPNNIYHLNSLEYLIMDKNKIKIFSELIGNLRSLRLLSLSKNLIAYLPKSIGNLQFLEILNLSYNNINSLPDSIGNLNSLKLLDLSYNHIDSFPKSLDKINSLKKVILKGNNLTEIPKSNFEIIT